MKLLTFNVGGRLCVLKVVSESVLKIHVSAVTTRHCRLKMAPPRDAELLEKLQFVTVP